MEETEHLFRDSPINITTDGKRHLGAAIGSNEFKNDYIDEKVKKWCAEIDSLTEIAKSQPHAAYAAFIHGEQHKFTYFLRTISDISDNLKPLDDCINNKFIPALFGHEITDNERELISLPIRDGGLGLRLVANNADLSYSSSTCITKPLTQCIISQSVDLPDKEAEQKSRTETISRIKQIETEHSKVIKDSQSADLKRTLEHSSEAGASSWLGALPIAAQGLNLNKGEFQDSLSLRYMMPIKNLPSECVCGKDFDIVHAMNCMRGGFIGIRHNNIRDMECKLLTEVCKDVECEPHLQKIPKKETYKKTAITGDEARLDIRARGFWRRGQNAFFDVRVTNIDCDSQKEESITSILRSHELEKKRQYNRRVIEVEHGTLTPLVFTTSGVMSHECSKYHKVLAEKLSEKKGERYDVIMRYLRVKISFLALKSTLLCLRGSRSTFKNIEHGEDFGFTLGELGLSTR